MLVGFSNGYATPIHNRARRGRRGRNRRMRQDLPPPSAVLHVWSCRRRRERHTERTPASVQPRRRVALLQVVTARRILPPRCGGRKAGLVLAVIQRDAFALRQDVRL